MAEEPAASVATVNYAASSPDAPASEHAMPKKLAAPPPKTHQTSHEGYAISAFSLPSYEETPCSPQESAQLSGFAKFHGQAEVAAALNRGSNPICRSHSDSRTEAVSCVFAESAPPRSFSSETPLGSNPRQTHAQGPPPPPSDSEESPPVYTRNTFRMKPCDMCEAGACKCLPSNCHRCKCKKSRCLKMYCECFAAKEFCSGCSCENCLNTVANAQQVLETRRGIELRNPDAFQGKILKKSPEVQEDKENVEGRHLRGCHCKRSHCMKRYCECFQAGVTCTAMCKCEGCLNCQPKPGEPGAGGGLSSNPMQLQLDAAAEHADSLPRPIQAPLRRFPSSDLSRLFRRETSQLSGNSALSQPSQSLAPAAQLGSAFAFFMGGAGRLAAHPSLMVDVECAPSSQEMSSGLVSLGSLPPLGSLLSLGSGNLSLSQVSDCASPTPAPAHVPEGAAAAPGGAAAEPKGEMHFMRAIKRPVGDSDETFPHEGPSAATSLGAAMPPPSPYATAAHGQLASAPVQEMATGPSSALATGVQTVQYVSCLREQASAEFREPAAAHVATAAVPPPPGPPAEPYPYAAGGGVVMVTPRARESSKATSSQSSSSHDVDADPPGGACKRCHCKKSKCLKLYCECFLAQMYCTGCQCQDCHNTEAHATLVERARAQIKSRDPQAFTPKVQQGGQGHKKGCHCKRSFCLKKYCECFQAGVECTDVCKCEGCKNGKCQSSGLSSPEEPVRPVPMVHLSDVNTAPMAAAASAEGELTCVASGVHTPTPLSLPSPTPGAHKRTYDDGPGSMRKGGTPVPVATPRVRESLMSPPPPGRRLSQLGASPSPAHGLNVLAECSFELGPALCTPLTKTETAAMCEQSAYYGVTFNSKKRKYHARLSLPDGRHTYLGYHDEEQAAARTYDAVAFRMKGHSATFNFIAPGPTDKRPGLDEVKATLGFATPEPTATANVCTPEDLMGRRVECCTAKGEWSPGIVVAYDAVERTVTVLRSDGAEEAVPLPSARLRVLPKDLAENAKHVLADMATGGGGAVRGGKGKKKLAGGLQEVAAKVGTVANRLPQSAVREQGAAAWARFNASLQGAAAVGDVARQLSWLHSQTRVMSASWQRTKQAEWLVGCKQLAVRVGASQSKSGSGAGRKVDEAALGKLYTLTLNFSRAVDWDLVEKLWTAEDQGGMARAQKLLAAAAGSSQDAAHRKRATRAAGAEALVGTGGGGKRGAAARAERRAAEPPAANREQKKTSRYRGVSWHKERSQWLARLYQRGGKYVHLGYFTSEESAARAYDKAVKRILGPAGVLNFAGDAEAAVLGDALSSCVAPARGAASKARVVTGVSARVAFSELQNTIQSAWTYVPQHTPV